MLYPRKSPPFHVSDGWRRGAEKWNCSVAEILQPGPLLGISFVSGYGTSKYGFLSSSNDKVGWHSAKARVHAFIKVNRAIYKIRDWKLGVILGSISRIQRLDLISY